ncbi:alpha/beta fold hydrolase [Meridianimarinicoccus zhengii]|uniref:alpha/beta fold hydrolase n=1 Tax=Meridianimarinicoccus zhengii TaxID=2056810 RepID=UPI000DAE62F0|nr:alpha/beta hydrolase [Phycocomes zhengii]
MTPDQIIAAIGLLMAEPDPAFDTLRAGGFDPRYPVAVDACPETTSPLDIEGQTIICGTVSVPENYDAPDGRRIPLEFALGRAHSTNPFDDAIVYLHGGPAGGALSAIGASTDIILGDHRPHRDVVTFDQRASMLSSTTIRCNATMAENIVGLVRTVENAPTPEGEEPFDLGAFFKPCIDELYASGADLPAYNTENNARDVRALMSALGYPEYNIFGISYGTRLALEVLRTAPEGVRSVIIDGVAPPNVHLYDDLFGPHADSIEALFDQCAAQSACAEAYPDLRQTFIDLDTVLTETPIPAARGMPTIDADLFYNTINQRTKLSETWVKDLTRYLPRIIHELAEGDPTTFDWYMSTYGKNAGAPQSAAALLGPAGATLGGDERALALSVLESAQSMSDQAEGVAAVMAQLKHDLVAGTVAVSVAEAFDQRASEALRELSQDEIPAAVQGYARMQAGEPSRAAIGYWILAHFHGPDQTELMSLVNAMSEDDIARTFDIASVEMDQYEGTIENLMGLRIYACQEDFPFNSRENGAKLVSEFPYDVIAGEEGRAALESIYTVCDLFEPAPREGFQTPVVSDVPVLVAGGTNDTQTSWKWSHLAAETLGTSQVVIYPNSGHGASLYSKCGRDINAKFILDPGAELDLSCVETLTPQFELPDATLP